MIPQSARVPIGLFVGVLVALGVPSTARAQTCPPICHVADATSLDDAIATLIASPQAGAQIVFDANITLASNLTAIQGFSPIDLTIDGNGHTLSGNNQFRGLIVSAVGATAAPPVNITINNLTIKDTVATGGAGEDGGLSRPAAAAAALAWAAACSSATGSRSPCRTSI